MFSQVALFNLSFFGEFQDYEADYLGTLKTLDPIKGISAQMKATDRNIYTPASNTTMGYSQSNFMSRQSRLLKDMFEDKMKVLENEKNKAMLSNNLDEAKKIKVTIDKTMKLSKLSHELEYKKVMAIENEDYDAAKIIKVELDKVKKNLMSLVSLPKVRGSSMSSRGIKTPLSDTEGLTKEEITDPGRQLLHSISQIQHDLDRINYNVDKPDPMKSYNHNFKVNQTYDRPRVQFQQPNPLNYGHQEEYQEQLPPQYNPQYANSNYMNTNEEFAREPDYNSMANM